MAGGVQFTIDTSEINAVSQSLAAAMGQWEWITARAMTTAAKASRDQIRNQILPMIKGGPTAWTNRGLIVKYASRNDLTAMAGFQYGEGKFTDSEFTRKAGGIPAGRYMGINARGGDRRPKGTEKQLRRAGLIGADQFVTPASKGARLNAQGNLPGAEYQRILSRLRGIGTAGSTQNAPQGPGSRGRTAAKRRQADYFLMRGDDIGYSRQLGSRPLFIAKRIGRRGRGFVPVLFITDQPNYERRFPVESIAMREFRRVFPQAWQAGLAAELKRRR